MVTPCGRIGGPCPQTRPVAGRSHGLIALTFGERAQGVPVSQDQAVDWDLRRARLGASGSPRGSWFPPSSSTCRPGSVASGGRAARPRVPWQLRRGRRCAAAWLRGAPPTGSTAQGLDGVVRRAKPPTDEEHHRPDAPTAGRSASPTTASAEIFTTAVASVAWAEAGYGGRSMTATPPKTSPAPRSFSTTSSPVREWRTIRTRPVLTRHSQRAGSLSWKMYSRARQHSSRAAAARDSSSPPACRRRRTGPRIEMTGRGARLDTSPPAPHHRSRRR